MAGWEMEGPSVAPWPPATVRVASAACVQQGWPGRRGLGTGGEVREHGEGAVASRHCPFFAAPGIRTFFLREIDFTSRKYQQLLLWCIKSGQLRIKAQICTAARFATFLSGGVTQAGDPEARGKGCGYFLVRESEVYPVINSVSI